MTLRWLHEENPPRWDEAKVAVVGAAPEGALDIGPHEVGETVPGEWWRVEDDGEPVGHGWMDTSWEGAEMLLAVRPDAQGKGVGSFIVDRLVDEAKKRGVPYLFNTVQPTHPQAAEVTRWLEKRGFEDAGDGELRRHVRS